MGGTLRDISTQLSDLLGRVERANDIPNRTKRDMVVFIDRVVEVVEQAYREVFRLAVELKYIGNDELTSEGVANYQREAERLQERDRYRDVQFICGRLHVLRTQFHEEGFDRLTGGFDRSFQQLINLIDDREGELIRIAGDFMRSIYDGLRRLHQAVDNPKEARRLRDDLSCRIEQQLPEMKASLEELHQIHNHILPTVGGDGLVELLSRDPKTTSLSVDASQHIHVGGDVVGRDKVTAGREYVSAGRDVNLGKSEECLSLDAARSCLLAAVNDFPADRRGLIQSQIDQVYDAINRKAPASEIESKAKALEMFLESGKQLLPASAKAGWRFLKEKVFGK